MFKIFDDKHRLALYLYAKIKNVKNIKAVNMPESAEQYSDQPREKKNHLPKRVGIVFVEELPTKNSLNNRLRENKSKIKLNFDQFAFAHLFLQLNKSQRLFDFQIVSPSELNGFDLPKNSGTDILNWFIDQIQKFEEIKRNKKYGIDYWLGITSEQLWEDNLFCQGKLSEDKWIWVITSHDWEKKYCPPSLFEYLISLIIMCCLNTLSHEYNGSLYQHEVDTTSGCIFENTQLKTYRRISVSNPLLCFKCKEQIQDLDNKIKNKTGISLKDEVDNILSKEWMGSLEKRDSPIYNLKRNYKYNIDLHSGFYKTQWEKFRDSITEKSAEWIIGGICTAAFALFVAYITTFLPPHK
jgi:hypothetical protein